MKTFYLVATVPVRRTNGAVVGWARVDPTADGTSASDTVFLRDGTACGQEVAARRLADDPALFWATRDEAVRDGINRLRRADARR